jgi:hypothetical protein
MSRGRLTPAPSRCHAGGRVLRRVLGDRDKTGAEQMPEAALADGLPWSIGLQRAGEARRYVPANARVLPPFCPGLAANGRNRAPAAL